MSPFTHWLLVSAQPLVATEHIFGTCKLERVLIMKPQDNRAINGHVKRHLPEAPTNVADVEE